MMTHSGTHIQIPLDIPNVNVLQCEILSNGQLLIRVESAVETVSCGLCQCELRATFGHGQEIRLRHLSILGLETYICLRPRRGRCLSCETKPTTSQVLDWYEQRSPHTKAYEQYLLKQLVNSTIEDVSLRENIGYEALVGVLNRQVDTQVNWADIEDLGTIGIDEVSLSKGRKSYAAVISARQQNGQVRVLAVLPDRKKRV
jgi:transposase